MATFNFRILDSYIKTHSKRAVLQEARSIARDRFASAKQTFLDEFLSHPISEEINLGPKTEGDSLPTGNLFSFIGFEEGDDPIGELYQFLDEEIALNNTPAYDVVLGKFTFNVFIPSKEKIKDETPAPFGTSRSWLYSIESGLPGLNNYLFSQKRNLGRSSGAIQVKGNVNNVGAYRARRYFSELLNALKKNL